jgi:hypothetical protein
MLQYIGNGEFEIWLHGQKVIMTEAEITQLISLYDDYQECLNSSEAE